jgi:hypothetical protein
MDQVSELPDAGSETRGRPRVVSVARGLIEVRKQAVGEDAFDFRRVRNSFKVPRDDKGWIVLPSRARRRVSCDT